jgi:hypothetical protein
MKEKILFAIKKHFYNVDGTPEKSAQEIDTLTKEHYMRFVEWFGTQCYVVGDSKYSLRLTAVCFHSENEAYQYWIDNVSKD